MGGGGGGGGGLVTISQNFFHLYHSIGFLHEMGRVLSDINMSPCGLGSLLGFGFTGRVWGVQLEFGGYSSGLGLIVGALG